MTSLSCPATFDAESAGAATLSPRHLAATRAPVIERLSSRSPSVRPLLAGCAGVEPKKARAIAPSTGTEPVSFRSETRLGSRLQQRAAWNRVVTQTPAGRCLRDPHSQELTVHQQLKWSCCSQALERPGLPAHKCSSRCGAEDSVGRTCAAGATRSCGFPDRCVPSAGHARSATGWTVGQNWRSRARCGVAFRRSSYRALA